VKMSGGDILVRPDFHEDKVVVTYTVSVGHDEVESRLTLTDIQEHNFAPVFSGLYKITYLTSSRYIFAFHAEDKNGGDTWTMNGGAHQLGDIASVSAAHLNTNYSGARIEDQDYGHFMFKHGTISADDATDYYATVTLTVRDKAGATGTIFVDLEKLQKGVGPVYHYSPVILDLDNDGIELLSIDAGLQFDWDGDSEGNSTGWVGGDDGFLVYDYNHDHQVTQADELSLKDFSEEATTDLEGLRAFDSNENGMFDGGDDEWTSFGVWQDKDGDGVTGESEFSSLDELGITSINLESDQDYHEANGNIVYGTTTYTTEDGTTHTASDVGLTGEEVDLDFVIEDDALGTTPSSAESADNNEQTIEHTDTAYQPQVEESSTASLQMGTDAEQAAFDPSEAAPQLQLDETHLQNIVSQLASDMASSTAGESSLDDTTTDTTDFFDDAIILSDDNTDSAVC